MTFLFDPFTLIDKAVVEEQIAVLRKLENILESASDNMVSLLKDLSKVTNESSHHTPEEFDKKIDEYANKLSSGFRTKDDRINYLLFFVRQREALLNDKTKHHLLVGQHKEFRLLKECLSFELDSTLKIDIEDAFKSLTANDQSLASFLQLLIYLNSHDKISLETKKIINSCLNHQIITQSPLLQELRVLCEDRTIDLASIAIQGVHSRGLSPKRTEILKQLTEQYPLEALSSYKETLAQIAQERQTLYNKNKLTTKEWNQIGRVLNNLNYMQEYGYKSNMRHFWAAAVQEGEDGKIAFFKGLSDALADAYDGDLVSCFKGILERLLDNIAPILESKKKIKINTESAYVVSLKNFLENNTQELSTYLSHAYTILYPKSESEEDLEYERQDKLSAEKIIEYTFEKILSKYIDSSVLNMLKGEIYSSLERQFGKFSTISYIEQDKYEESSLESFQEDNKDHLEALWKSYYKKFEAEKNFIPYFSNNALSFLFSKPYDYESMNKILDIYERNPYQDLIKSLNEVSVAVVREHHNLTGGSVFPDDINDHRILQLHQRLSNVFFQATKRGRLDVVNLLLENGINVNTQDQRGSTPLMYAARYGEIECVRALLKKEVDVNKEDQDGFTSLMLAAQNGHIECLRALLEAGAKVETKNRHGDGAFIWAAVNGHTDCVRELIKAKVCVDTENQYGNTALMYAARYADLECLKALLEAGAEVNKIAKSKYSALMHAVESGHLEIVKTLIDAGADVNIESPNGKITVLIWAAGLGHLDLVQTLLDKEIDISARGCDFFQTALMSAVKNNHQEIVKALLSKASKVQMRNINLRTPLATAVESGNLEIVKALIDAGADVNTKTPDGGMTVLIWAAGSGHLDLVQTLLDKKVKINERGRYFFQTALVSAVKTGRLEIVKALLSKGANVETRDAYFRTPLIWAADYNNIEMARVLLEAGANVDSKDNDSDTALSLARYHSYRQKKSTLLHMLEVHNFKTCLNRLSTLPQSQQLSSINTIIDKLNEFKSNFEKSDNKSEGFRNFQKKVEKYIRKELRTNRELKIHKPLKIALLNILLAIGTCGGSLIYSSYNAYKGGNFLFFSSNKYGKALNDIRLGLIK